MKANHVWAGENRSKWLIYFDSLEELTKGIPKDVLRAIEIAVTDEKVKCVTYGIEIEIEKDGGRINV